MKKIISVTQEHPMVALASDITYMQKSFWCGCSAYPLKLSFMRARHRYAFDPEHENYPCIVFVCGGAWEKVDRNVWMPNLAYYCQKGYAVASVDYSCLPVTVHPEQVTEIKTAIRFLRMHAAEFRIDPERIAVMGESAGAYLAALTGLTGDEKEYRNAYYPEQSDAVRAVCTWYAPTDIHRMNTDMVHMQIRDFPVLPSLVKQSAPPFLMLHGVADSTVPSQQSEMLYEALQNAKVESDLILLEGAEHADYMFQQPSVKELICDFMDRHLK